jgi:4-amino-4-deoxy-L-arabinose transferase-like glycosyltransferase
MVNQSRAAILTAVLLFCAALVPRILPLESFVTVDEAYHWFRRVDLFVQALYQGNYAGTDLVGHPGVTTLWLGAIGSEFHQALALMGIVDDDNAALTRMFLRIPVAIATCACLSLAYLMLRRLFGPRTALAAGILWAAEPMLVAHSQLLHVDALLTSFISVSLLAGMLAWRLDEREGYEPPQLAWLFGSAVAGGLALLTKSPSLILLPMLALIALLSLSRAWRADQETSIWSHGIFPIVLWIGLAAGVWIALWPATWVSLPTAVMSVIHQVEGDGGAPHAWGNYFMGEAVADPGPLFYLVVAALRGTPRILIGLIIAGLFLWKRPQARGTLPIIILLAFTVLFTVAISIPPKKFDRYLLPIFPALAIVAGWGFAQLLGLYRSAWQRWLYWVAFAASATAALVALSPYTISYYNPIFGGGETAAELIPIGWGEGFEQVGAYISAQPDGDRPVATWYGPALKPFVPAGTTSLKDALIPGKVEYAVLYIDQVQRRDEPEVIDVLSARTPIHTVWINDIPYPASIRSLRRSITRPTPDLARGLTCAAMRLTQAPSARQAQ